MRLTLLSLALAAGALLLALFRPTGAAGPERVIDAASPVTGDGLLDEQRALREQIAALDERLEQIEMRQNVLEARPSASPRQAAVPSKAADPEIEPVVEKLRALATVLENPELAADSEFESLVLNVLEAREREEEAAREERRRIAQEERIAERVANLTEQLGLDLSQSKDMHRVLTDTELRRDEFFTEMREDGSFDRSEMRDGLRTIRDEARTELQAFLAPAQYDSYIELEESDRRGFFGGGPGGGGPGGGGNRGGGGGNRGGGGGR